MSIILIVAVICFFVVTSLVAFGMWHSYRDEHILGSLVFLWLIVAIFLLAVLFSEKKFRSAESARAGSAGESFSNQSLSLF